MALEEAESHTGAAVAAASAADADVDGERPVQALPAGSLRKSWCTTFENPMRCSESMAAVIDPDLCTGCATCVDVCPAAAIWMEDGKANVDPGFCIDCGACIAECPSGAIHLE
jgi:ferredoxin